ncbi:hypothetical protein CTAM01_03572 [Colletotrichum tamarilloi]|uniref:Uncharacterized protein n=1 Tax=Colletotrichum tamarilloi TaxID=1209934 RepID=A0ABQ9RK31_9PEZI|nr:uncharacterized protein CTAM01_03572 [Colletotrichum tamarilloi]KAK1506237.1 hypothetical protein CTAM01_03572 [Colletotrichum tamarilloi]
MARPVKPTRCCRKVVDRVVRLDNAWVRPGDTNQQWYDWSLSGAEGGPPRCGKDAAFRTTNCPGPAALEWSWF